MTIKYGVYSLLGLYFLCFSVVMLGEPANADSASEVGGDKTTTIYRWLRTMAETTATVEKKAFRNVDFSKFMLEGLKAAVASIDAHSAFIENFEEISEATSGSFSGIGVSVIPKTSSDEAVLIVDVVDDGPACMAGIRAGDRIIGIDDEKLRGLNIDEVVRKMKGKRGSKVKLKIIRNKKPLEIEVTRDVISDQSSTCYYLPHQDVCYFSLRVFSETSAQQFKELFAKCQKTKKCRGVILDLRDNPGGVLEAAVEMASLFLPKNSLVVTTRNRANDLVAEYRTTTEPIFDPLIPLFILTNNFTASASEILAGCLRHYSLQQGGDWANRTVPHVFVVGNETHGKGSVQEVIPVSNGCALKLTTMLYFLPNDVSIQELGVKPDFDIKPRASLSREMKWIAELFGKEKSLKHHITHEEVEQVLAGKTPSLSSKFDKEQEKTRQELEDKKEKEDLQDEEIMPEQDLDRDGEQEATKAEKKREELISKNYLIQICINMIAVLDSRIRRDPESVATHNKAAGLIRKNIILDDGLCIEKIK